MQETGREESELQSFRNVGTERQKRMRSAEEGILTDRESLRQRKAHLL